MSQKQREYMGTCESVCLCRYVCACVRVRENVCVYVWVRVCMCARLNVNIQKHYLIIESYNVVYMYAVQSVQGWSLTRFSHTCHMQVITTVPSADSFPAPPSTWRRSVFKTMPFVNKRLYFHIRRCEQRQPGPVCHFLTSDNKSETGDRKDSMLYLS